MGNSGRLRRRQRVREKGKEQARRVQFQIYSGGGGDLAVFI